MTIARVAAYHIPNPETSRTFLEYDKMTSNVYTFMASTKTTVSRDLYRMINADKSLDDSEIKLHLGYVGTSSLNSVATLATKDGGPTLARNINQVVTVDKATRKSMPIPDWWKNEYETSVVENERLVVAQEDVPLDNVFHYEMKVSWNEIDSYRHTNYQSYVKFCFDAAMDAVSKSFYTMLCEDILKYNVKSIQCLYRGESVAGDILKIASWEDKSNPYVLSFSVTKDSNMLFQSQVEFYQDE